MRAYQEGETVQVKSRKLGWRKATYVSPHPVKSDKHIVCIMEDDSVSTFEDQNVRVDEPVPEVRIWIGDTEMNVSNRIRDNILSEYNVN